MRRYEIRSCPFCEEGEICCSVFGGHRQEKRGAKTSLGRSISISKSSEVWVAENDCNICKKTIGEINKMI